MEILRFAIRRVIWLFAKRPANFRLRGYYVPVAHDAGSRTTFIDWSEYMDSHDTNQGGW